MGHVYNRVCQFFVIPNVSNQTIECTKSLQALGIWKVPSRNHSATDTSRQCTECLPGNEIVSESRFLREMSHIDNNGFSYIITQERV